MRRAPAEYARRRCTEGDELDREKTISIREGCENR
jgi:hypothetical protein